jgi:hypothetical protein
MTQDERRQQEIAGLQAQAQRLRDIAEKNKTALSPELLKIAQDIEERIQRLAGCGKRLAVSCGV